MCHSVFLLPMHHASVISATEEMENCERFRPHAPCAPCSVPVAHTLLTPCVTSVRAGIAPHTVSRDAPPRSVATQAHCKHPFTSHATIAGSGLGSGSGPNQDEGERKGIGIGCNLYAGNLYGGR